MIKKNSGSWMGKALNADVHSPVEKPLFNLFSKHLFNANPVPGIMYY